MHIPLHIIFQPPEIQAMVSNITNNQKSNRTET